MSGSSRNLAADRNLPTANYMTIDISSANNLTDYAFEVEIPYNHGIASDFSNIRFYDASGNALPYWQYAVSENLKAWYIVKTDISSAGTTITAKWNTGDSDTGSMADVFDSSTAVFDDFEAFSNTTIYDGTGETYKNYAPKFLHLPDGRYMVVWKYGNDTAYSGTQMFVSYSSDKGKTWTSRANFDVIPSDSTNLVYFPPIFYKEGGTIYMFYQSEDVSNFPNLRASKIYMKTSTDGINWSSATLLYSDSYGYFLTGNVLKMSNGKYVIPAWRDDDVHYAPTPFFANSLTGTWTQGTVIDHSTLELNETAIVEDSGTLIAYMRTAASGDNHVYMSTSSDYGATWGSPTALRNNAQITPMLIKAPSGKFLWAGTTPRIDKYVLSTTLYTDPTTDVDSYETPTYINLNYSSSVYFSNGSVNLDDDDNIILLYGYNDEKVMFVKTTESDISDRFTSKWIGTQPSFSMYSSSDNILKAISDDYNFLLSNINITAPAKIIASVRDFDVPHEFGFGRYHYTTGPVFDSDSVVRFPLSSTDATLLCTQETNSRTYLTTGWTIAPSSSLRVVVIDWDNTGTAKIEERSSLGITRGAVSSSVPVASSLPVFIGCRQNGVSVGETGYFDYFVAFHYDSGVSYTITEAI